MTRSEFLRGLEEILEADAGSLSGEEDLNDVEGWDSLAVVSFLAMVDEKFGMTLQAGKIQDCATVRDLMGLLGGHIT